MKRKILICDKFHSEGLDLLNKSQLFEISHELSPFLNLHRSYPHEILITRSRTKITDEALSTFPNLKKYVSVTSGFDHIDLTAIRMRNIQAEYCPEANADAAAELTWGLIIACNRHLIEAHIKVSHALWRSEALVGSSLKGKTLFLVGFGRIGKRVANFAQAFQMKVCVYDPYIDSLPSWVRSVEFEEGLATCDVLSFHVPKTSKTFHMLNESNIYRMKSTAFVINTSRGEIIEEKALVHALSSKSIRGAGLDVFANEPLGENSAFFEFPNVILSPHAGAFTEEAFKIGSLQAAEKTIAYVQGQAPSDPLPPRAKWIEDLDTML